MKRKFTLNLYIIIIAAIVGIAAYVLYLPNPVTNAPVAPVLSDVTSGGLIVRIAGDSMEPTMSDGDLVTVRDVPFGTVKVNDVILIQVPNGIKAIKRVININSDGSLQIKSDNRSNLGNITEENYLGKVVKISHKDGTVTALP